jgi:FdhD protein
MDRPGRTRPVPVRRVTGGGEHVVDDVLAVEEPLAIRVAATDGTSRRVAVTMRTPGDDHELAVGWLLAEGVLTGPGDVLDVAWCVRDEADPVQTGNVVTVTLARDHLPDLASLDRHGLVSSACGVCGRASLEALAAADLPRVTGDLVVPFDRLAELPDHLRAHQPTFDSTGGLHAAARVDAIGAVLDVREDVGRHNAVDKLLGSALLDRALPWHDQVLVLSGRASYELLQKAVVGGVPVVAAIGAPSTLAVEVADAFGVTLVGFLRPDRANVYTHAHRVAGVPADHIRPPVPTISTEGRP